MDVAGFSFGSIALIGQLATACLSAYGLLQDAKSTGEDATHFHLLVTTQMTILSLWVKTWIQPGDPGGKLLDGVSAQIGEEGCLLVLRILAKISKTLSDAEILQTRYGIHLSPTITSPFSHPQSIQSSTLDNPQASTPQSLPQKEESPPITVKILNVNSGSTLTSAATSGSKTEGHKVRGWLTRTGRRFSALFHRHSKHHAQKPVTNQPAESQTTPSDTHHATVARPTSKLETQLMDIGSNLSALEETKTEILKNLSKVQCLKWALFDKVKGLELARELEYWNDTLVKILPSKTIEPPKAIDPRG